MTYIYTRTPTRLHYPARLRALVIMKYMTGRVRDKGSKDDFYVDIIIIMTTA